MGQWLLIRCEWCRGEIGLVLLVELIDLRLRAILGGERWLALT